MEILIKYFIFGIYTHFFNLLDVYFEIKENIESSKKLLNLQNKNQLGR